MRPRFLLFRDMERVYAHRPGRWKKFTGGGTLKNLCEALRDYVTKDKRLNPYIFGPWREWVAGGDLWGYGKDMEIVRATAKVLGVTA